jgi:hypothetical protein
MDYGTRNVVGLLPGEVHHNIVSQHFLRVEVDLFTTVALLIPLVIIEFGRWDDLHT